MVKVTNKTDGVLTRRHPSGTILKWAPRQSKEITSERVLAEVSKQECFEVTESAVENKVGAGVKTHVKPTKPRGRPLKAAKKEVAKPKKGLKSKKGKAD